LQSYIFCSKIGLTAPKNGFVLTTLFDNPFLMPLDFLSNPERLRYHTVPTTIQEPDLRQFFHLTQADREFLRPFRRAANRLGIGLQLGLIRFMGFLPETWWEQIPVEAVSFVAQQQRVEPGHLNEYGARQPTLSEHFRAILKHLRFRKWEPLDVAWLEPWLLERALEHDGERVLLEMTCLKLRQLCIVRPGISTLERLVGGMNELAYQETYRRLAALLTDHLQGKLDALLEVDPMLGGTRHRWLVQGATLNNPSAITLTVDKLIYLTKLGVPTWDTTSLPPNRQKRLALLGRNRSNRHLERLPAYKRYAILVAFLRESLLTLTDDVLSLFDGYWEHSLAKARRDYDQYQQQAISAKDTTMRTLGLAVGVVLDETEIQPTGLREAIYARVPREQLTLAWEAVQALLYPTRHSHLTFLAKRYSIFKQFTPQFLGSMSFCQGFKGDDFGEALQAVSDLQTGKRRKLPIPVPTGFMKPNWRKFVVDAQGECNRQHYELCVLSTLRDRLRSGDVFVEQSHRYADFNSYLIPPTEWETLRDELCRQLNLPILSTDRITQRISELEILLKPMQALLLAGGDVRLEKGEVVVSRLTAEEVPLAVKALQQEISQRMPVVDLTDILVEVNAWVGFTDHLPGLENAHRSEEHTTLILAAFLATACNIPLSDMARSSGLAYQSLWWTSSNYLCDDTLKAANTLLVNEHHRQWLASYWGDGTFSSSDGQRFPVSGKVRNARALPTYFGTGKGVTMQTHSSDQYVQYGSKVVPATLRDATVVLDEIVGNETDLRIAEHTTDTAGYTDIIFALFDLLNMTFCPRIRDIGDQKLSKVKGEEWVYPDLKFTGIINPDYIKRHWNELTRLAGSIQSGRVTASLFIGKLQAYPRQNNLTYVLQEYGQLIKTIFILRYLQSQPLRRRINAQLNKGEELHALRSWLWFGSDGMIRRKQQEAQSESARCLTMLTNMVLLWNTVYMQDVLRQLQIEGYPIDEAHFTYLSPGRYEHINRLGKYSFATPTGSGLYRRPLRKPIDKLKT
jgi:TnpA family transposase